MQHLQVLLLAILALGTGCAATAPLSDEMAAWQGNRVDAALDAWGEPEATRAFGDETILIWRDRRAPTSPSGLSAGIDREAVVCERMLAVAADGTVTGWRWRGDACVMVPPELRSRQLSAAR